MLTYEQDPDVVRWGLQLFDSDPYSNCGYLGTVIQDDCDGDYYHQAQYFKQESYDSDSDSRNVENDEVIAHALQEELSQLAILDEPGSTDEEGIEHLQVSGFSQDWPELDESAAENYGCGKERGFEFVWFLELCIVLVANFGGWTLQERRVVRKRQMMMSLLARKRFRTVRMSGCIRWGL